MPNTHRIEQVLRIAEEQWGWCSTLEPYGPVTHGEWLSEFMTERLHQQQLFETDPNFSSESAAIAHAANVALSTIIDWLTRLGVTPTPIREEG